MIKISLSNQVTQVTISPCFHYISADNGFATLLFTELIVLYLYLTHVHPLTNHTATLRVRHG